jgi:DNA-3-methyladenine glycosylase II
LVKNYLQAECHLKNISQQWENLIQHVGSCKLSRDNDLQPHQSIIKSIFFQQLHLKAAEKIYQRFLNSTNKKFPTDDEIIYNKYLFEDIGLSLRKKNTIIDIAKSNLSGKVPDQEKINALTRQEIISQYTQIKGVGKWTVDMMLIFNQGWIDVMPSNDLAIRKSISKLNMLRQIISPADLVKETEKLSPYRSIAAWYLWQIN